MRTYVRKSTRSLVHAYYDVLDRSSVIRIKFYRLKKLKLHLETEAKTSRCRMNEVKLIEKKTHSFSFFPQLPQKVKWVLNMLY